MKNSNQNFYIVKKSDDADSLIFEQWNNTTNSSIIEQQIKRITEVLESQPLSIIQQGVLKLYSYVSSYYSNPENLNTTTADNKKILKNILIKHSLVKIFEELNKNEMSGPCDFNNLKTILITSTNDSKKILCYPSVSYMLILINTLSQENNPNLIKCISQNFLPANVICKNIKDTIFSKLPLEIFGKIIKGIEVKNFNRTVIDSVLDNTDSDNSIEPIDEVSLSGSDYHENCLIN